MREIESLDESHIRQVACVVILQQRVLWDVYRPYTRVYTGMQANTTAAALKKKKKNSALRSRIPSKPIYRYLQVARDISIALFASRA